MLLRIACKPDPSGPGLSNSDEYLLARQLIRPSLPHDLHDYVLEGLCKAVDGIYVLLVVRTEGGYFMDMYCFYVH